MNPDIIHKRTDVKRIIVVGGSAAGPKAAARARRLDEQAEIIILQKAPDLSMASCGYEAARVLEGRGWTNVKVMEGGIAAWPYHREK
jgi:hypothetical protein